MARTTTDFDRRRAPYAPVSAMQRFFERMRELSVPDRVDHEYLRRLNVAANNEYALLSALKFLGVVDQHGVPTHAYRLLQLRDRFPETLAHLLRTSYAPVFEVGAERRGLGELTEFFRATSSASQARNAARLFDALCRMAGGVSVVECGGETEPAIGVHTTGPDVGEEPHRLPEEPELRSNGNGVLLAKVRLLEKLPAARAEWSGTEYRAICESFLAMMESLDRP